VSINSCFSPDFNVCFSKQKHPILFKYIPNVEGETLKDAEAEVVSTLLFSILNLTVCISPGFRLRVLTSG